MLSLALRAWTASCIIPRSSAAQHLALTGRINNVIDELAAAPRLIGMDAARADVLKLKMMTALAELDEAMASFYQAGDADAMQIVRRAIAALSGGPSAEPDEGVDEFGEADEADEAYEAEAEAVDPPEGTRERTIRESQAASQSQGQETEEMIDDGSMASFG